MTRLGLSTVTPSSPLTAMAPRLFGNPNRQRRTDNAGQRESAVLAVALLMPPLLLVLLVLLDHYEERVLGSPHTPRHAARRHLRLVPTPVDADTVRPDRPMEVA